jgi:acyl-CoA synthetase (AMP-forming)/AMP-acid ligase II
VLFAGEVFPIKYLRRLVAAIPQAAYYNLYGPTETNVCTYYRVQPHDVAADRTQPVPIGQACGNIEVFAVNQQGGLVTEPGLEGELWARGACVAQGYWGDREKTEKAFVQNPFNPLYPDLAYRTGDIVTLSPDRTNWIYVGRRDHMIKSRGYRVELGEIESALYRHDQVKEAAVIAIPDDLLGNRIQAFVVAAEGSTVTPKELELFCSKLVPKYMVPEKITLCSMLPKTSSGKVDRTALSPVPTKPVALVAQTENQPVTT